MNQGRLSNTSLTLLNSLLVVLFCSTAFAFPTYEGCKDCHGGFDDGSYTSKHDGSTWNNGLMDGHEDFVGGTCNACHKSGSEGEVYLNFSIDNSLSKSCVGCHGRDEDVNGSCVGGSGTQEQCGSGDGLRKIHEAEVGPNTCNSCHTAPTPVGEQIAPSFYGQTGVIMQDPCDGDSTESRFGATGLDNDGDGQRDGNDSDCQSNSPPTQPGTLSASLVTTNSATVSWIASTDADGDTITYQVDYRRNGDSLWSDGGNTTGTSQPLSGLDSGQSYDVRITPNDGTVNGPIRFTLGLFQTDNFPPGQPGTLAASLVTTNSATVSWGASTDAEGDDITYQVDYRPNGQMAWIDGGSTAATSQPLSGLISNQAYDVRVTPNDGTVDGPDRTAPNLFQTEAENSPPGQPGVLSSSLVTTDSATVSWDASIDADGDDITYQVDYRPNGQVAWIDGGNTAATSQPLAGLDPEQSYDVRVTPNDGTVDGPDRTAPNLFQTEAENSPPGQPGALSASLVTINSATVSWGVSTDVDDDPITYQVDYRRTGQVAWIDGGSTAATSQPLSGLSSDQAYDVRVTPNDGTEDGPDRTAISLFQTEIDVDLIHRDGFESN